MSLFYEPSLAPNLNEIFLNEQESHHAVKVLRYQVGDEVALTDGAGHFYEGILAKQGKRQCQVAIDKVTKASPIEPAIHLAITPLKNRNRMEWMTEKATELGAASIIFLQTNNTERHKVNEDRVERVVISAVKQSLRAYKPSCHFMNFTDWIEQSDFGHSNLLMAECETPDKPFLSKAYRKGEPAQLLFGPEGDLSANEIKMGKDVGFHPVSLGNLRLRAETAAVCGIAMVNSLNQGD